MSTLYLNERAQEESLEPSPLLLSTYPASQSTIQFYDAYNIDKLPWPDKAVYAKKFLTPLVKDGVSPYIRNIQTKLYVLLVDQVVIPITVNEAEYHNSHVSSPYSYYISLVKDSLTLIRSSFVRAIFVKTLNGLGKVFKWGQINKAVIIDNWLTSINFSSSLNEKQLLTLTKFLKERFPDHALLFRAVDQTLHQPLYKALKKISYHLIPSRRVFLQDGKQSIFFESRVFKKEKKLLRTKGYEICRTNELTEEEQSRVLELYEKLYIHKHSASNPHFTLSFIKLIIKENLFDFILLKKEGRIDGVATIFCDPTLMCVPFVGYDLTKSKKESLYRQLYIVLMLEAQQRQILFHQGSGVATFKTMRKATSSLEYQAVHCCHLPYRRRMPWWILGGLYHSIGRWFIQKY